MSRADLAWLHPGEEIELVGRRWLDLGAALVVISLGREGALAIWPGGSIRVPGVRVDVVDTVGAGDAFTAGLLASLHAKGSLHRDLLEHLSASELTEVLMDASRVAAITCTRVGADPPYRHEAEDPGAGGRRASGDRGPSAGEEGS